MFSGKHQKRGRQKGELQKYSQLTRSNTREWKLSILGRKRQIITPKKGQITEKNRLREEFDTKLEQAEIKFKASATSPIEKAAGQTLPRSTSRNVRGNVEQQLKHKIHELKYDLNRKRSAGFERDKDLQRIRRERGELREDREKLRQELRETNKLASEQTDVLKQIIGERDEFTVENNALGET